MILGYSLGGQLAAEFAIRFANKRSRMIEKLVLVAPTGTMTNSTHAMQKYIITLLYGNCWCLSPYYVDSSSISLLYPNYMIHVSNNVVIPEELIRNYSNVQGLPHTRLASVSTMLELGLGQKPEDGRLTAKLQGRLPQINCPTLLIWGYNDRIVPIENSKGFIDEIPNCKMCVIQNCGHIPHLEKPIEFSKTIEDFLLLDDNEQEDNKLPSK
jgi:pimeloyl-ACP methyl ester carboxylesterase